MQGVAASESGNLTGASDQPSVSVLVLVTHRAEPLSELYEEIADAIKQVSDEVEFVFVVEPAFVELTSPLAELEARGEPIRVLKVGRAVGETALLRVGASRCRGRVLLTVPSYRQVETASLGALISAVEAGADLAVARRWPRRDSWFNRAHTRLFHAFVALIAGRSTSTISDVACGVRAMRPELLDRIPLYGDWAVFLPLLASRDAYSVEEIPLPQHATDQGIRWHSPFMYLRRLLDLLGVFFLVRFTEKPLRFFGLIGSAVVLPGAAILAILLVQRLAGQGIADRPLLLLGVLFVVLGIQAIALGLIGEIIVHLHAGQRRSYRIRREDQNGEVSLPQESK